MINRKVSLFQRVFGSRRPVEIPELDRIILDRIAEWSFFLPDMRISRTIIELQRKAGDEYFTQRYENTPLDSNTVEAASAKKSRKTSKKLTKSTWRAVLNRRFSNLLLHGTPTNRLSEKELEALFQKDIAQLMFNHLAMLMRSPQVGARIAFSLKREFTEEISELLGLDFYLSDKAPAPLKQEISNALFELAKSFEDWFVKDKGGHFSTPFGEVFTCEAYESSEARKRTEGNRNRIPVEVLLLNADVRAADPARAQASHTATYR